MISIVIPAYNESSNVIKATIMRCASVMNTKKIKFEIILVDDGSSEEILRPAISNIKIIKHPHNVGYGQSLKDGIKEAKYDTVVISDADGTYPIESIPKLLDFYNQGFDMVVGARTGKHFDESFQKKILRLILKNLVEYTAGRKIPDINSGLRIFSKKQILPFYQYLCNTFSFTTSLTLAYMMNGFFVKYVPIDYEKREGKSKVRMFRDSLRTLQFIIEAMLFYNPMKVFFAISMILLTLSIASGTCYLISEKAQYLGLFIAFIALTVMTVGIGLISVQLRQLLKTPSSHN
jgi:glycosyltransferase involved in cell wall biosynthesis